MTAPFAAAAGALSTAVDGTFGERLRIEPQLVGTYSAGPDPDRPSFQVVGTLRFGAPAQGFTSGDRQDRRFHGEIDGETVTASIDRAQFAGGALPQQGDVLVALDRAGSPRFVLPAAPAIDGLARVVVHLARA